MTKETAQTPAQRQEAMRARRAMLGMTEVRGIYAPPELHAAIKEFARKLSRRATKPPEAPGSV